MCALDSTVQALGWRLAKRNHSRAETPEIEKKLVGGLEPWNFTTFHFIYGMSSFPLTNSYFSSWLKHVKTTKQMMNLQGEYCLIISHRSISVGKTWWESQKNLRTPPHLACDIHPFWKKETKTYGHITKIIVQTPQSWFSAIESTPRSPCWSVIVVGYIA